MKSQITALLFICLAQLLSAQYPHLNTERILIQDEDRTLPQYIQVSLPYNYGYTEGNTYPVLYLMDGDYNFQTMTGVVESLSGLSGNIPDMIVVGITGAGGSYYRTNATPSEFAKMNGRADEVMDLIEQKIQPYIQQNYRASNYEILAGHSLGGLFTSNYFVQRPDVMDHYIATDPSIWWSQKQILSIADSTLASRKTWNSHLYLSLADSKQMAVREMVGVLDKNDPSEQHWTFYHFPEETHGSVGIPTVRTALRDIFKGYSMPRNDIYDLEQAQGFIDYFSHKSKHWDSQLIIPSGNIGSVLYHFLSQNKMKEIETLEKAILEQFPASANAYWIQKGKVLEYMGQAEQAIEIYNNMVAQNALEGYEALAKAQLAQGNKSEAIKSIEKAIELGKKAKLRQWHMNELMAVRNQCKY